MIGTVQEMKYISDDKMIRSSFLVLSVLFFFFLNDFFVAGSLEMATYSLKRR